MSTPSKTNASGSQTNDDEQIILPDNVYYFTYITLFITGSMLWFSTIRDAFSVWPFFVATAIFSFILGFDTYKIINWEMSYSMSFIVLAIFVGCIMNLISGGYFGYVLEKLRETYTKLKKNVELDNKNEEMIVWFQSFWVISTILIIIASKYIYHKHEEVANFITKTLSVVPLLNIHIHSIITIVLFLLILSLGIAIYNIIFIKYGTASELSDFRVYFLSLIGTLFALLMSIVGIELFKKMYGLNRIILFSFFIASIVFTLVGALISNKDADAKVALSIFGYSVFIIAILYAIFILVFGKNKPKLDLVLLTFLKIDQISKIIRFASIIIGFILSGILFNKFISIPDVKIAYSPSHFYGLFISFIVFVVLLLSMYSLCYIFETTTQTTIRFVRWIIPLLIVLISGYQMYLVRSMSSLITTTVSE